jgi:hypothetical protein
MYFSTVAPGPNAYFGPGGGAVAGGSYGIGRALGFVPLGSQAVSAEVLVGGTGEGYEQIELAVSCPGFRRTYVLGAPSCAVRDTWLSALRSFAELRT